MKQRTLAMMTGFEQYTRKTRRAIFLEEMEQVVPWGELCALVAPHYPQPGKGRRPVGVERMLRIYFLQQWFNLSDPAVEEAEERSRTFSRTSFSEISARVFCPLAGASSIPMPAPTPTPISEAVAVLTTA